MVEDGIASKCALGSRPASWLWLLCHCAPPWTAHVVLEEIVLSLFHNFILLGKEKRCLGMSDQKVENQPETREHQEHTLPIVGCQLPSGKIVKTRGRQRLSCREGRTRRVSGLGLCENILWHCNGWCLLHILTRILCVPSKQEHRKSNRLWVVGKHLCGSAFVAHEP